MTTKVGSKVLPSVLLVMFVSGCSVSYSVEKSSDSISESLDSISASFDSFSNSSASGGEETAQWNRFVDDIGALVRTWVLDSSEPDEFEFLLGDLALSYGITDWENEPAVFTAIGSGLRRAGVDAEALERQPFLQLEVMRKNYDAILTAYSS